MWTSLSRPTSAATWCPARCGYHYLSLKNLEMLAKVPRCKAENLAPGAREHSVSRAVPDNAPSSMIAVADGQMFMRLNMPLGREDASKAMEIVSR